MGQPGRTTQMELSGGNAGTVTAGSAGGYCKSTAHALYPWHGAELLASFTHYPQFTIPCLVGGSFVRPYGANIF
jgi:hypothetical protein